MRDFRKLIADLERLDHPVADDAAEIIRSMFFDEEPIHFGNLTINPDNRVYYNHEFVHLPRTKIELLRALIKRKGGTLSRESASIFLWDADKEIIGNTLHVHISQMRAILHSVGCDYIKTVWGIGWRLSAEREAVAIAA